MATKSSIDLAAEEILNDLGLDGKKIMDFLVKRLEQEIREHEINAEMDRLEEEIW